MLGLFGTLNLGARSLQVQRQGVEVAGHNLANANNPAYARQRIALVTALTIPTPIGPQGTGADVVGIRQLRSALLDYQIVGEASVRGYLEAQQQALQFGEAVLGQSVDRLADGPLGSAAAQGVGGQHGIAEGLAGLFAAFQSLSTNPTSITERQAALLQAQTLANQFNQIDARLSTLRASLNDTVTADVTEVNDLLRGIAGLNQQIIAAENGAPGTANDLRDLRQQKLEALARLVNLQAVEQANGGVDLAIAGAGVLAGPTVLDTLEAYDPGTGNLLVRTATGGTPLALTGGSLQGVIEARDGALTTLRNDLNTLAAQFITQVNAIHSGGFGLNGTTGANFFTGTGAADIAVNAALLADPARLQASGVNGAVGDNQVALALAQLGNQPQAALNDQTFSRSYAHTVAAFGQTIFSVNGALSDQEIVEKMLWRQRDAVSGVSLDEEMTDLIKFQKAFEASARLIVTVDEMLQTVVDLKR
jgi:flagellar hook-associated protein 1 FlgK